MVPISARILLLGACLFGIGATMVFLGMARESGVITGAGITVISLAALTLLVGGRSSPDRLDQRREQRLWRSGPLGRSWLQRRKRLP